MRPPVDDLVVVDIRLMGVEAGPCGAGHRRHLPRVCRQADVAGVDAVASRPDRPLSPDGVLIVVIRVRLDGGLGAAQQVIAEDAPVPATLGLVDDIRALDPRVAM